MRQRRRFTREFKGEAVGLSKPPVRSAGEVAKSLDVGEGLLRRWRDELVAQGGSSSGKPSGLEEEIRKLRAEVERLWMEREILKATVFFAKESR